MVSFKTALTVGCSTIDTLKICFLKCTLSCFDLEVRGTGDCVAWDSATTVVTTEESICSFLLSSLCSVRSAEGNTGEISLAAFSGLGGTRNTFCRGFLLWVKLKETFCRPCSSRFTLVFVPLGRRWFVKTTLGARPLKMTCFEVFSTLIWA